MPIGDRPQRAVVAVIRRDGKFLAIKRSKAVRAPGKICFPGGGIESNETEREALVRELQEELGASVEPVKKVWQSTTSWGVQVSWYQARLLTDEIEINEFEVQWCRWISLDELVDSQDLLESNSHFFESLQAGLIQLD